MKDKINGITYDTDRCERVAELKPDSPNNVDLCQTPSGHFFLAEYRFYLNGRKLPDSMPLTEFYRTCVIHPRGGDSRLGPNVQCHATITPIPRRRALGLALRALMPRTFHKDLARFLK
jgi:hypothetical protein